MINVLFSSVPAALFVIWLSPFLHAAEEDLSGPPVVTAKSWAIMDAKAEKILWQHQSGERFKSASITKMMCAYTVLKLAEREPAVMEEWVTFSKLADITPGSTSEIKEGEKVKVKDCLYGLMLPSGNDAGNALAQHFNSRFEKPDADMLKQGLDSPLLKSRVNFLAEMNRHARQNNMDHTFYRSPYGDGGTLKDLTTSVRDLCRLAVVTMKLPEFRKIVSTASYETLIKTPSGSRKQAWKNTNVLLNLEMGYDGIKTGHTPSAGDCLVSSGHRGEDHLYVVVLGSTSPTSRFADTRNLFRWAWTQRAAKP